MNTKLSHKTSKIKVKINKSLESEESNKSCKIILEKNYIDFSKSNKDNKTGGVNNTNINISINNNSNNINNFQYNINSSPETNINNTNKKESKTIFPKIKSKKRVYLLHDLYYKFGNKSLNKKNNNLLNEEKTNKDVERDGLHSARNKSLKFYFNNCKTEEPKNDSPKNVSSRSLAANEDLNKIIKIYNLKLKNKQNEKKTSFKNSTIRKNKSYNERLFNEYRRKLSKEFIKYLDRFKCLFLKKYLIEFFQNIKQYTKKKENIFKDFRKRNNSSSFDDYLNNVNMMSYIKPRVSNTNEQIYKNIDSNKKKNALQKKNNPEFSTQKYFYSGDFNSKSDENNYYKTTIASNNETLLKSNQKLNKTNNDNRLGKNEEDSNDNEEKLSIIISAQEDEILNGNSKNNSNRKYKMSVKQNKNNDYFHNLNNKTNNLFLNENIKKSPTSINCKQQKVYIKKNNMINNIKKTKQKSSIVNKTFNIDYISSTKNNKNSRNENCQLCINNNSKRDFISNNKESINNNKRTNNNENDYYQKRMIPKESFINYHNFVNNRIKNFLKSKYKKNYNSFDDGINENNSPDNVVNSSSKKLNIRFNAIPLSPKAKKYKKKYYCIKVEHKDDISISSLKEKERQFIIYHKKNKSNYTNYNHNKNDLIYIKEEKSSNTAKISYNNINSLINQPSLNNNNSKKIIERKTYENKIKDLNNIIKNNNNSKYLVSCLNFLIKTLTKIKNNTLEEYFYKLEYYAAGNSLTEKLKDIKRKYYTSLLKRKSHKNKMEKKEDNKKDNEIKNKNEYNDVDNDYNNHRKKIKKKKQNEKLTNNNRKKIPNNSKNKKETNIVEK